MDNYYAGKRPGNINTVDDVKIFQRALGVPVTGVWDSRTKTACLIQPAKAKKVGNDIAKLREASKSNVNTPQIKPAGVTPYNWATVNVLPTASDYPGSKRAAPTSAGLLGAGTIAYLQNHREKNKSGDLSGLGRSSSSTASSGSGYHPGYGGLDGTGMLGAGTIAYLQNHREKSKNGDLSGYKAAKPVGATQNSYPNPVPYYEEIFEAPPIPKKDWSEEHANAVEQYNNNHKEHMEMAKIRPGKSYDLLSKYAAENLEVVDNVKKELDELKNQADRYSSDLGVYDAIREKQDEFYQALYEYASIPILLTEDTLSNPYAAEYAELLSTRMLTTPQQYEEVNAAIKELNEDVRTYETTGDRDNMNRALEVRNILGLKKGLWAELAGAGAALVPGNLPRIISKVSTMKEQPRSKQLTYLSSLQGIESSNPLTYKDGEELGSFISLALELMGIPSGDPSSGLVDIAFDYETGRSGNLIEDILDMLENK